MTTTKEMNTNATGLYKNASFRLYKGKNTGDGAASSWQLALKPSRKNANVSEIFMFVELAPQSGKDKDDNATFDWKSFNKETNKWNESKSVSVKLNVSDIGEFLTVLNGVSKGIGRDGKGLYHDTDSSNTIIYFSLATDKEGKAFGFNFRLSHKNKTTSDQNSVSHFINFAEAEILRVLLNSAVLQMTKWEL